MGEAVVGAGREIEDGPALAVWAAVLPGTEVLPFRLVARPLGEGLGVLGWPDAVADAPAGNIGPIIMVADPFTFPADGLLAELNDEPGAPVVVGGPRLRRRRPGVHRLFAGRDVLEEGAAAVALRGATMRTVVSQGCMPVGPGDGHHRRRGLHRPVAGGQAGAREAARRWWRRSSRRSGRSRWRASWRAS